MRSALGAVFLAVYVSGCSVMPWPHMANVTPKVRGSIESSGKPVPNVSVRVATGAKEDMCAGTVAGATTGPDGLFVVDSVREFRFFLVVMGHDFFPWNLCYRDKDDWAPLSTKKEYALVDSGPIGVQVVHCDLSRATNQKCQVTWEEH